ncbi:MAG TPA: glycoside hydrolase family 18 protein [Bacteroidota bacterium]|nr:glycoside hydrolase family 18 protein [Bacteroidota bacterium]
MTLRRVSLYLFIVVAFCVLYLLREEFISASERPKVQGPRAISKLWVTAYYPEFGDVSPAPSEIDWTAFTHIIIFTCGMNASTPPYFREMPGTADSENFDGGYNKRINWVKAIVDSAHRHSVKALMCIAGLGGSPTVTGPGSTGDMEKVMNTPGMRHEFISYVAGVNGFARRRNLDGLDFDFEYPGTSDEGFKAFIRELRDTLDHWPVRGMITSAVPIWQTPVYSGDTAWANNEFDQINIMAYGCADGSSVTGFNSPLVPDATNYPNYNGTSWFGNGYGHGPWDGWVKFGIQPSKIGVIIPFEMRHVAGNDAPGQTRVGSSAYANYSEVVNAMNANPFYHSQWDPVSKVPWFGYDDGAGKHYYSYENRASIQAKVDTIRNAGYGGVGIWELFRGYVPNGSPPDELLQDLKHAIASVN